MASGPITNAQYNPAYDDRGGYQVVPVQSYPGQGQPQSYQTQGQPQAIEMAAASTPQQPQQPQQPDPYMLASTSGYNTQGTPGVTAGTTVRRVSGAGGSQAQYQGSEQRSTGDLETSPMMGGRAHGRTEADTTSVNPQYSQRRPGNPTDTVKWDGPGILFAILAALLMALFVINIVIYCYLFTRAYRLYNIVELNYPAGWPARLMANDMLETVLQTDVGVYANDRIRFEVDGTWSRTQWESASGQEITPTAGAATTASSGIWYVTGNLLHFHTSACTSAVERIPCTSGEELMRVYNLEGQRIMLGSGAYTILFA